MMSDSETASRPERSRGDPAAPTSRNPFLWLTFFGPGAVIASLTIGAGELIFSSRGGALFGYRLLWLFLLVLVLKWVLAFATARHMVLSGAHPFQRWTDLPGPRGWFPMVFFLLALPSFPIWVSFHAGTLGTLLAWGFGTEDRLRGNTHFVWGALMLLIVLLILARGGYARLERIQLAIVALMLICVVISFLLLRPDWGEVLKGFFWPRLPHYPDWIGEKPEFAGRSVWVEIITYVGILGGSAYDYLAYVSYLRAKHWGRAGRAVANQAELRAMADQPEHPDRRWLRAVWADSILSFVAVLIFAGVFVVCGAIVLGPQHQVPGGTNLLRLQAGFIHPDYGWLQPLYFAGAFLAIFGTLYGTIEVAPAILNEMAMCLEPAGVRANPSRFRSWAVAWSGLGGLLILSWNFFDRWFSQADHSSGLISILTPVNLFTGVLACGLICLLSFWADARYLPRALRLRWPLLLLNGAAALIFLGLGIKAYWDHSRWSAFAILAATIAIGWVAAKIRSARRKDSGSG